MARPSSRTVRLLKWTAVPAALVLSGLAVSQASYSAFSATTTTPANTWTSGQLQLADSQGGSAAFSVSNIKPDDSGSKCITVTAAKVTPNTTVKLYSANFVKGAKSLGDKINVTVTAGSFPQAAPAGGACTGFTPATQGASVLASTPLTTFNTTANSYATGKDSWAPAAGDTRVYRIDWAFPTSGSTTADNAYQGDTAKIDFVWEAQITGSVQP